MKPLLILILTTLFLITNITAMNPETNNTTLQFTINNKQTTAHMIHNPTSDGFLQLLPLNLELKDLYSREKYAELPMELTAETQKIADYDVGYVAYYEPTNSFVVYYADDGDKIPGGIVPLPIIEDNIGIFEENNTNVTIEIV